MAELSIAQYFKKQGGRTGTVLGHAFSKIEAEEVGN